MGTGWILLAEVGGHCRVQVQVDFGRLGENK